MAPSHLLAHRRACGCGAVLEDQIVGFFDHARRSHASPIAPSMLCSLEHTENIRWISFHPYIRAASHRGSGAARPSGKSDSPLSKIAWPPTRPTTRAGNSRRRARSMISSASAGEALQHIAALVLAEPCGVRRQLAFIGEELHADAASERHLGNGDQQAAVAHVVHGRNLALPDQRAHEVAGLDLVGEVDWRRRALDLARDDQLIERLRRGGRLPGRSPPAGRPRS